jgi:ATP-dependent Clp protease protease subunit
MKNNKGLYDEVRQEKTTPDNTDEDDVKNVYKEIDYALDLDDSIIYLIGEIGDYSLYDIMTRSRIILKNRKDGDLSPINLIINSQGGDLYEMMGIIDYITNLSVKVNTICRGSAMSAAAVILSCGTGERIASKHSTIMFHEASSFNMGKQSDLKANVKHVDTIEEMTNALLADKTKMDANWWKEKQRVDMYITAQEALELGVIDKIN